MKLYIPLLFLFASCMSRQAPLDDDKIRARQDSIITEFANGCAHKYNYRIEMKEWQSCLDKGLSKDSTIAYLWQQKAMPYFKARKYEVGMNYLDRAVRYDNETYLPYRAFIKCIFSKNYTEAIKDFEECKLKYGERYEMDHTYSFYLGLSHLQLNRFEIAERLFRKTINEQQKQHGEAHHIDLFYHAITLLELKRYPDAIATFDKVLQIYPQFAEALYYKANCLLYMDRPYEEYLALVKEAQKFAKEGYSINEANAVYERYPYQVNWN